MLSCNLRSDSVLPEAALFLLWVALAVWGPLCFHVDSFLLVLSLQFCEEHQWNFDGDCLEFIYCW